MVALTSVPASLPMPGQATSQPGGDTSVLPALPNSGLPEQESRSTEKFDPESMINELKDIVSAFNKLRDEGHTQLSFLIDRESQQLVVRVIDATDGRVIRELSPDSLWRAVHSPQGMKGVLLDLMA